MTGVLRRKREEGHMKTLYKKGLQELPCFHMKEHSKKAPFMRKGPLRDQNLLAPGPWTVNFRCI
jgi:hypothetical protein